MAVTAPSLSELDAAVVADQYALALQRVQEDNGRLDLRRGVFSDLLVALHAALAAMQQDVIEQYRKGRSLKALSEDPGGADPDLVDDVLSNYGLTRKEGTSATGEVTVVLDADVTTVIPAGAAFEALGKTFLTDQVYTGRPAGLALVAVGDRRLRDVGGGRSAFEVNVAAAEDGTGYEVRRGTAVVPAVVPPHYVTSYAAADFIPGLATETNAELLDRLQQGVAAKAVSNRVNMAALLRATPPFDRVVAQSIVGFGDAEMLRDRHWIWPSSGGGRVDWYVRTSEPTIRQTLTLAAVLVDKGVDGFGTWQFSLSRDDYPGFYEVVTVRLPADADTAGFAPELEERAFDLSGDGLLPDVTTAAEAAYSRYQTAVVRFRDTVTAVTDLALGVQADYAVEVSGLPLVAELQDFVGGRGVCSHGADCLVKAPVPCFVRLALTVHKQADQADPDVAAIREALAAAVNRVPFTGALYASLLTATAYPFLADGMRLGGIDMLGRVRDPNGTSRYLRGTEALTVPDDPDAMVSARTVQFFAAVEDVGIDVVADVPSGV